MEKVVFFPNSSHFQTLSLYLWIWQKPRLGKWGQVSLFILNLSFFKTGLLATITKIRLYNLKPIYKCSFFFKFPCVLSHQHQSINIGMQIKGEIMTGVLSQESFSLTICKLFYSQPQIFTDMYFGTPEHTRHSAAPTTFCNELYRKNIFKWLSVNLGTVCNPG